MIRIVKTFESIVTVEDFNDLFHSFGHSDQVRMYGLNRHPTSKTDSVTLTADPTVVQEETEPLSATQTHVEAGFNHKKSNIPAPPGGNVETRTNIATIKYPQFYQHYLGFEHLEKVSLHYFPHFQTDKIHQKHLPVHQEYLQHFPPCCQEPQ